MGRLLTVLPAAIEMNSPNKSNFALGNSSDGVVTNVASDAGVVELVTSLKAIVPISFAGYVKIDVLDKDNVVYDSLTLNSANLAGKIDTDMTNAFDFNLKLIARHSITTEQTFQKQVVNFSSLFEVNIAPVRFAQGKVRYTIKRLPGSYNYNFSILCFEPDLHYVIKSGDIHFAKDTLQIDIPFILQALDTEGNLIDNYNDLLEEMDNSQDLGKDNWKDQFGTD